MEIGARSKADLRASLGCLGSSAGLRPRSHDAREWYCLRRYLLTLSEYDLLEFPIRVSKQETPDFRVSGAGEFGIEVVEATTQEYQQFLSVVSRSGSPSHWSDYGSRDAEAWARIIVAAISKKADLLYSTAKTRLLVYSNSKEGGWLESLEAVQALQASHEQLDSLGFDDVAVLRSDELIVGLTKNVQILRLFS